MLAHQKPKFVNFKWAQTGLRLHSQIQNLDNQTKKKRELAEMSI